MQLIYAVSIARVPDGGNGQQFTAQRRRMDKMKIEVYWSNHAPVNIKHSAARIIEHQQQQTKL